MNLKGNCTKIIERYFVFCLTDYLGSEFCERFSISGLSSYNGLSADCRTIINDFNNTSEDIIIGIIGEPMNYLDEVSFVINSSYMGLEDRQTVSMVIRKYHHEDDNEEEYRYLIYMSYLRKEGETYLPGMSGLLLPKQQKEMDDIEVLFNYIESNCFED